MYPLQNGKKLLRLILSEFSAHDPICLISLILFIKKLIYCVICIVISYKILWDEIKPLSFEIKWEKLKLVILQEKKIPSSISLRQESGTMVDLNTFVHGSVIVCCATACTVFYQPSSVSQSLKTIEYTLSKKGCPVHAFKFSYKLKYPLCKMNIQHNLLLHLLSEERS